MTVIATTVQVVFKGLLKLFLLILIKAVASGGAGGAAPPPHEGLLPPHELLPD